MALAPHPGAAGILLEGELAGQPGAGGGRQPIRVARWRPGRRPGYLVDLDRGEVRGGDGGRTAGGAPAAGAPPTVSLERWSDGPLVAGYGSTYHVLIVGERICGEVLASPWMTGFTAPLVRALALLQAAVPPWRRSRKACGAIGLRAYADDGFPLLAG